MAGDEIRCEGCGVRFTPPATRQGPRARYHSPACRKASSKRRRHHELATETADVALAAGHERLSIALSVLAPSSLASVRALLRRSERIVSPDVGDGLCSPATTTDGRVVSDLHNEEG